MLEVKGDMWQSPAHFYIICTNGVLSENGSLVMGKGIALEAKKRFPGLPQKLGMWVREWGNRVFICHEELLITFPTKRHWRDDSDLWLIEQSAKQVVEIVDKYEIKSVAMPRPGCGAGNLSWTQVKPWLVNILDDRFTVYWN